MTPLLKLIYQQLSIIHPRIYQRKVSDDNPIFPYVIFKFPTSSMVDAREDFIFEVDIWDNNPDDTTALETLTTNISNALDYKLFATDDLATNIYKINQLQIPDPDETINRNQLRFQAKTYLK